MQNKNELIDTILDIGQQCLLQRQGMSVQADISQIDFAVIDILDSGEKVSCNDLANKLNLSPSRCSRIVERLLRKGYVERKPDPEDRRAIEVSLTTKGGRIKRDIEKLKTECEKRLLGTIGPGDIEIVKQGIGILRKSLSIQQKPNEE
ncbi:MAG: MarR family transcriptional regulator [Chitinispirillaceae bacterium]|nr:MarR family transcriptional regulator [Chitinispirillaceae bacterium]